MADHPNITIDYLGGNCPVQAEGIIDGQPFYFRARGAHWSLGIGGEPVCEHAWEIVRPYGKWPDAGWMTPDEAEWFIRDGVDLYRADKERGDG